ncbi:MAG: GHMP kinase [Gemmataceae bacterium]
MRILRKAAYARAGLLGNPSDGYHGKTISISVRNFKAEVVLYEWEDVEIVRTDLDQNRFDSVQELVRDVKLHGYYGGMRLIKAAIKKFVEYCVREKLELHDRNFSIRYDTNVPRQVGMAGSSAIIVAALRCLMEFYEVDIPLPVQPSLVLSVEQDELGITAGLQDRVIQVYEGLVYMDFAQEKASTIQGYECGEYEPLDPKLLPLIYIAYNADVSEPTEVFHNDIRGRFNRGDHMVRTAMETFAGLAENAKRALEEGKPHELAALIDKNFDTRLSIARLPEGQVRMVEVARQAGASAKFAGSGGAIIGTYTDQEMYNRLKANLTAIGCKIIKPKVSEDD